MARRSTVVVVVALAGCRTGLTQGPLFDSVTTDPQQAVVEARDIARYWEAVDSGGSAATFDRLYLARASDGLRDFARLRQITGASLAQARAAVPGYLGSIRASSQSLAGDTSVANGIRRNYALMKLRYPEAVFPPLTFVIGRFSTGGTVGDAGILVGAEFYTKAPDSPTHELSAFVRTNIRPIDSVGVIIAHEHVHVLQRAARGLMSKPRKTLLEMSLLEGSADFLGELVTGGNINGGAQPWALAREDSLWTAFQKVMHDTDYRGWLYNQQHATPQQPGDLGYFIGYRIAKAYYDAAVDKAAAFGEIVRMSDARAFLRASGYAP